MRVTAGQTTTGIDFNLAIGASIAGGGNAMDLGVQSFDIFDSNIRRGSPIP